MPNADLLAAHLRGDLPAVCREPDGTFRVGPPWPPAVLPGSFNPLHAGHTHLAAVAARVLGGPVAFELSSTNADKPPLPEDELRRRLSQFDGRAAVWVTRAAALFEQKADLFPAATFVLGFDTAVRLIDPKYYGGEAGRDACLRKLRDRGCRLLVGGRLVGDGFRVWEEAMVGPEFAGLFRLLGEEEFRRDVSSTELRRGAGGP